MSSNDRRLAIEKLRVRAELRSAGDDEDTGQIEVAAMSRRPAKPNSTPAPARALIAVLNTLPSWGRVLLLLAIVAALVGGGMLRPLVDRVVEWLR
jgi:hypothetical protein